MNAVHRRGAEALLEFVTKSMDKKTAPSVVRQRLVTLHLLDAPGSIDTDQLEQMCTYRGPLGDLLRHFERHGKEPSP